METIRHRLEKKMDGKMDKNKNMREIDGKKRRRTKTRDRCETNEKKDRRRKGRKWIERIKSC